MRVAAAFLVLGALVAAGCGNGGSNGRSTLTVLAAASLTDALDEVAAVYEAEHPGIDVAVTFASSSSLAAQIREGVPADVFVSADEASIEFLRVDGLLAGEPVTIATNELVIVVPEGNPDRIDELADLAFGLRLALCAPEAPCGRYSAAAFERAGLQRPEASEEGDVRGVLTKVSLGEADAGIVYATDVRAADGVEGVALPPQERVRASYPAAVLADAVEPGAARSFVELLSRPDGQAILADLGFGAP